MVDFTGQLDWAEGGVDSLQDITLRGACLRGACEGVSEEMRI